MEPPAIPTADLFSLRDRTIIITGGLGGMGTSLTGSLLDSGADVLITDLSPSEPTTPQWLALKTKASSLNLSLRYAHLDITNESAVRTLFSTLKLRHPLRGLVCAAGTFERRPALDWTSSQIHRILDTTLAGTFQCCTAAARRMKSDNVPGSIVIVASMSGYIVNRGIQAAAYNASKAGLHALTRSLASEWGGRGDDDGKRPIRVNSLSPGYILTEATGPMLRESPHLKEMFEDGNFFGRLSVAHEYRAPILFLLGDGSSFVTGTDLRVDGGHCAW